MIFYYQLSKNKCKTTQYLLFSLFVGFGSKIIPKYNLTEQYSLILYQKLLLRKLIEDFH